SMPAFARGGGWTYYRLQVTRGGNTLRFFFNARKNTWVVQSKSSIMELGVPLDGEAIYPSDTQTSYDDEVSPPTDAQGLHSWVYRWKITRLHDEQSETECPPRIACSPRPSNPIVFVWEKNGPLTDIYDTPPPSVFPAALSDYAHHTHLAYLDRGLQRDLDHRVHTPTWRSTPTKLLS